jgi:hypothetical protein
MLSFTPGLLLAHGRLLSPTPRPPAWRMPSMTGHVSPTATYRENEPPYMLGGPTFMSGHQYNESSFRCHDFAPTAPSTTITAGGDLSLQWLLEANHPGDCSLYISYDEPTSPHPGPATYFKLANFVGCVDQAQLPTFDGRAPPVANAWQMTLPSWLPSASHAVLRWVRARLSTPIPPTAAQPCTGLRCCSAASPPARLPLHSRASRHLACLVPRVSVRRSGSQCSRRRTSRCSSRASM